MDSAGPEEISKRAELFKTVSGNKKVWYLFDPSGDVPKEPVHLGIGFTIVAASNPMHYKQLECTTGNMYYVPCWSWEELKKYRPHAAATVANGNYAHYIH